MEIPESEIFKTIFYEHHPIVRRKLAALVCDESAADDLAQEVFLRLYRNPPDDPAALGAWLHRVLTRIGYDYLDKKARERRLQNKQEQLYDASESPPSGEDVIISKLDQEDVHAWLNELPERDRQALLLRYSGYSYVEIAGELGVRPPVVGTLLHRATEKLRQNATKAIPQTK
ncbi:RNA polymerase subunit sigma-24 [Paenibacillus sp. VTT E-133280]|jgi:RNA polymerase sigma factor (sigma-70 family)|uniref:sigma-70 family RNA polymerase sigma factor n=1 Tax=Paenibacillus TaxID=44249 RepID=UPI000BA08997|nr:MULTISPECIES: sigma-70 family RNA polymerase sigma factor [unclassified Paenibacillus]MDH6368471.1 RNA polymerase sigma factor (sigma-70 family) [Paenibacillus sp. PastF-3]OZQ61056.1 RNA polymerase subunit sigma-24 [Paenibacillus sp. VTT E-133280]OZQ82840.1 RNA polymerase subunit sigma-24 [Paenibacillus sp. VTT E-133291]